MIRTTLRVAILVGVISVSATLWTGTAFAYPWMIRHEYAACVSCHADPSGSGLLTKYGRASGEVLLRMPYGRKEDEEPGKAKNFLWFLETPDNVLLGGSTRAGYIYSQAANSSDSRFILMQADLYGQVSVGRVRANATLGVAYQNAQPAWLTTWQDFNFVGRQFWAGVDLGPEKEMLLRVGRMNLPYGLRSNEHTMWIRSETHTNINTDQQYGVAFAFTKEQWRGEAMAIAGNFQMSPAQYREHGGSGYIEFAPSTAVAVGLSALATYAQKGVLTQQPLLRQAYGMFARYVPTTAVVLQGQVDVLGDTTSGGQGDMGYAGMLQADYEAMQGLHFIGAVESRFHGSDINAAFGGWGGINWFFAPHADIRFDTIYRSIDAGTRQNTISFLGQLHVYL